MKRRTNPKARREARPQPRRDYGQEMAAFVEANCPEHFVTVEEGRRGISCHGVLAYLQAVAAGKQAGCAATARASIPLIQEVIRQRESQNLKP